MLSIQCFSKINFKDSCIELPHPNTTSPTFLTGMKSVLSSRTAGLCSLIFPYINSNNFLTTTKIVLKCKEVPVELVTMVYKSQGLSELYIWIFHC